MCCDLRRSILVLALIAIASSFPSAQAGTAPIVIEPDCFLADEPELFISPDEHRTDDSSIAIPVLVDGSNMKPTIIAAPLPPAILSGLAGLACVYVYRRRNRWT